jgi:putative transposase
MGSAGSAAWGPTRPRFLRCSGLARLMAQLPLEDFPITPLRTIEYFARQGAIATVQSDSCDSSSPRALICCEQHHPLSDDGSLLSGGPIQVLRYLGHYTHRVAISNHRLLALDQERVTFRWKDYAHGSKQGQMTLTANVLRFFLTLTSLPELGCAEARRRISVLTQRPRPLSPLSADTRADLCCTAHTANPPFSRPLTKLLRPKLPFKSHSAPRPPQTPAASS